ncbi:polyubiquitin [Biomphalaria glabrata]|nr:polyubiquitin [Biomphalaria glabrata]
MESEGLVITARLKSSPEIDRQLRGATVNVLPGQDTYSDSVTFMRQSDGQIFFVPSDQLDQVDGGTDSILGSISINDTPKTLFQIFVNSYTDNRTHTFNVMESFSVQSLMTMIHHRLGIPPEQQKLQYAGRNLTADKPLSYFDIKKECTVFLTGRLRGG